MTRVFSGLLFTGVGLILAGFAVAMFFEALAILTGREPSLSALSAGAIAEHPTSRCCSPRSSASSSVRW